MIKAMAENIPFENDRFDVVYSSHALEHFQDRDLGLKEIERVLSPKGIAIIVVPTGTMALINLISQYLFTNHARIGRFLLKERSLRGLRHIFIPMAHGSYASTVIYEIRDFSRKHWKQLISTYLQIQEVILPGLYPYPDYPQIFPFFKSNSFSSSAIYICRKLRDRQRYLFSNSQGSR